jgi:hypothetical protein
MPDAPTPWVGLAALTAMFLLPLLPDWLFEVPRTSKHWPRRHICGNCGAPWTDEHTCTPRESESRPVLRGQLRRLPDAVHGARAAINPAGPGPVSRPGARSAHSAEPNRSVSQGRLGAHVRDGSSRAGSAARALPGHQGEAS